MPADGFFEWIGTKEARQPVWFHRPDGKLILFAGLYESWQARPGEWDRTFTIVTTAPNGLVASVHDRMPVILPEEIVDAWLDPWQEDDEALCPIVGKPEDINVVVTGGPGKHSAFIPTFGTSKSVTRKVPSVQSR